MEGFTALSFALCAQMVMVGGQDLVELGQTIAGKCETSLFIGDSHGETAPILGHDIGASMFDDGAEVFVDGLRFIVPKMARA